MWSDMTLRGVKQLRIKSFTLLAIASTWFWPSLMWKLVYDSVIIPSVYGPKTAPSLPTQEGEIR